MKSVEWIIRPVLAGISVYLVYSYSHSIRLAVAALLALAAVINTNER